MVEFSFDVALLSSASLNYKLLVQLIQPDSLEHPTGLVVVIAVVVFACPSVVFWGWERSSCAAVCVSKAPVTNKSKLRLNVVNLNMLEPREVPYRHARSFCL